MKLVRRPHMLLPDEVKALQDERDELRAALEAIEQALAAENKESGDYYAARTYLMGRDIYEGDLSGTRVVLEVARVALKRTAKERTDG